MWGRESVTADGVALRLVVKTEPLQQWAVARESAAASSTARRRGGSRSCEPAVGRLGGRRRPSPPARPTRRPGQGGEATRRHRPRCRQSTSPTPATERPRQPSALVRLVDQGTRVTEGPQRLGREARRLRTGRASRSRGGPLAAAPAVRLPADPGLGRRRGPAPDLPRQGRLRLGPASAHEPEAYVGKSSRTPTPPGWPAALARRGAHRPPVPEERGGAGRRDATARRSTSAGRSRWIASAGLPRRQRAVVVLALLRVTSHRAARPHRRPPASAWAPSRARPAGPSPPCASTSSFDPTRSRVDELS